MDKNILKDSMQLIFYAGNAKSIAMQAIEASEKKDFDLSKKLIKEARKELSQSHKIQTTMMQDELNGKKIEKSILLIHSQDHFMSASLCCDLAEKIIHINETI